MKHLFHYFLPYIKAYKNEFLFAILGMISVAAGTTASAHLLKPVLDEVFINKDHEMMKPIPFAIMGVFFSNHLENISRPTILFILAVIFIALSSFP